MKICQESRGFIQKKFSRTQCALLESESKCLLTRVPAESQPKLPLFSDYQHRCSHTHIRQEGNESDSQGK